MSSSGTSKWDDSEYVVYTVSQSFLMGIKLPTSKALTGFKTHLVLASFCTLTSHLPKMFYVPSKKPTWTGVLSSRSAWGGIQCQPRVGLGSRRISRGLSRERRKGITWGRAGMSEGRLVVLKLTSITWWVCDNTDFSAPPSEFLILYIPSFLFLTNSQMLLLLLVWGAHFKNHWHWKNDQMIGSQEGLDQDCESS